MPNNPEMGRFWSAMEAGAGQHHGGRPPEPRRDGRRMAKRIFRDDLPDRPMSDAAPADTTRAGRPSWPASASCWLIVLAALYLVVVVYATRRGAAMRPSAVVMRGAVLTRSTARWRPTPLPASRHRAALVRRLPDALHGHHRFTNYSSRNLLEPSARRPFLLDDTFRAEGSSYEFSLPGRAGVPTGTVNPGRAQAFRSAAGAAADRHNEVAAHPAR